MSPGGPYGGVMDSSRAVAFFINSIAFAWSFFIDALNAAISSSKISEVVELRVARIACNPAMLCSTIAAEPFIAAARPRINNGNVTLADDVRTVADPFPLAIAL